MQFIFVKYLKLLRLFVNFAQRRVLVPLSCITQKMHYIWVN
jgi:hypothetical protein